MFKTLLYILILCITSFVHSIQDKDEIKKMLSEMVEQDQEIRNKLMQLGESPELFQRMEQLSKEHVQTLKHILSDYEWITISEFDQKADRNAWLLVQHADNDVDFQKEILQKLERLYPLGETSSQNFAYLYDRVAHNENRPQRYGTQGHIIEGQWEPHEIEDFINLESRRTSMGMVSFQEYSDKIKQVYSRN
jgi:hypothetical protein